MRFNNGGSAVIMDDEGCRCRTREFVELSAFLRARGVYVPEVKNKDFGNGFLLLEDLGDDTVTKLLTDDNEMRLYRMAGRAAAKVAAVRERPQCVNELSRRRILDDLRLFTDWYFPMAAGQPLPERAAAEFFAVADRLAELAYRVPNRLVLWDYHIDNIMLPPNAEECAIIDFQDGHVGTAHLRRHESAGRRPPTGLAGSHPAGQRRFFQQSWKTSAAKILKIRLPFFRCSATCGCWDVLPPFR